MEAAAGRSERRGRKRRRKDVQNVEVDQDGKKRAVGLRAKALVSRYVRKDFEGSGVFLGKIVFYDSGLYRVDYEDGDCEDLDYGEVKEVLIEDTELDDQWLDRKKKLDELVARREVKDVPSQFENVAVPIGAVADKSEVPAPISAVGDKIEAPTPISVVAAKIEAPAPIGSVADKIEASARVSAESDKIEGLAPISAVAEMVEVPVLSDLGDNFPGKVEKTQVDTDTDSASDLSEDDQEQELISEVEMPLVPAPELPPSSGNIGISEEYVSYLFSVYSFLRSFSVRLFLSPFGLDDFVGALNCSVPNTLLDSTHVALMHSLRRHLGKLSSDGSELASKCLRHVDWSLLDTMTWPVYLVHYFTVMGYTDEPGWKGFYPHTLEKEYYLLSADRKLIVLQILCDDVLDSDEIRAEIDMREESEAGVDSDIGTLVAPVIGPRRVHPRYTKTSAYKGQDAIELSKENHETKMSCNANSLGSKQDSVCDDDQDGNGDECRLCGMDGTLLCCDGCPSSYHSRCIGVCKMYIPEGAWYCPECTINQFEPKIMRGTILKGAEIFGVDSYGQIFMGTCSHLLVLKALAGSDSNFRYYNEKDIPKVLRELNANGQHNPLYMEICKGIMQYWEIPANVAFPNVEIFEIGMQRTNTTECGGWPVPSLTSLVKESVEKEITACHVTEFGSESAFLSNFSKEHMQNETSEAVIQPNGLYLPNIDSIERQSNAPIDSLTSENIQVKSISCAGSVGQKVVPSDWTQQDITNLVETALCTSKSRVNYMEQVGGTCNGVTMSPERGGLYIGSSFKPQGYINSYLHGDFAASAAASLAVLSSEENRGSETNASDNRRKLLSASFLLQAKAFSSVAMRFFWPNTEKKLVEVPRERCSWCLSCKAPVISKKACLLNAAASNAIKGAVKILSGLRPAKFVEGSLAGIATYIILMEESLTGLTDGPFLSAAFRKQWRKQAEQATRCSDIKSLLHELEENIRLVAFSGDWVKLVDGGSSESSITHSAASAAGSTHKRKPGRRGRKPLAMVGVTADDSQDILTDFTWWRGGKISKLIFQKGTLPRSMVKKAARKGGKRKMSGIYYAEGFETAKRNRQLVWRAAVDMCKTTSQLAFQVRYLDMHVRWSDLARPEQSVQDGKGPETEASAFRNASIFDKRIVENEVIYGVSFGNQKHLPSRVMKSIIEVEKTQDEKEKYWFSESRIPLYLIKEYEEKVGKGLPSANKLTSAFTLRKPLRAHCKDIFSYLAMKRDGNDSHCCASCQVDVLFRNAVKCSTCQGLCHVQCIISSKVANKDESLITCKQCSHIRALTQAKCSHQSPTSPLLLQRQDFTKPVSANKGVNAGNSSRPLASAKHSSKMKHGNSSNFTTKTKSWGVIWRKKNEDTTDFRLTNILLKGNPGRDFSRPCCHLCHKPYDSDLMYIRCETCKNWYHADAVQLEEAKVFEVVGFKCCRCRRTRIPICPYLDPDSKKQLQEKRMRLRASKMDNPGTEPDSWITSELHRDEEMATQVVPLKEEITYLEDNALVSTGEELTEQYAEADYEWNAATMSEPGPKKLPVRRHVKNENDLDSSFTSNPSHPEFSTAFGGNIMISTEEMATNADRGSKLPVRRHVRLEMDTDTTFADPSDVELSTPLVEWPNSGNGFEEGMMFEYDGLQFEDMEFEPQTYFSFNELLESDDCGPLGGLDSSANVIGNPDSSLGFPPDEVSDASFFKHEPALSIESAAITVPCKMCSHTDPCPDLCCQTCGIWIHNHCSPWVEESSGENGWMCGNCRDWRF